MPSEELKQQVASLLRETEGYDDARQYISDIASDLEIPVEEVLAELRRQTGPSSE